MVVDSENSEALAKTDESILKNASLANRSRTTTSIKGRTVWSSESHLHGVAGEPAFGAFEVDLVANLHEPALLAHPNTQPQFLRRKGRSLLSVENFVEDDDQEKVDDSSRNSKPALEEVQIVSYGAEETRAKSKDVYRTESEGQGPPPMSNVVNVRSNVIEVNEEGRSQVIREERERGNILFNISISADSQTEKQSVYTFSVRVPRGDNMEDVKVEGPKISTVTPVPSAPPPSSVTGRFWGGECQCSCPCLDNVDKSMADEGSRNSTLTEPSSVQKPENLVVIAPPISNSSENEATGDSIEESTENFSTMEPMRSTFEEYVDETDYNQTEADSASSTVETSVTEESNVLICAGNVCFYRLGAVERENSGWVLKLGSNLQLNWLGSLIYLV